jgi:hypothetical protein
MGLRAKTQICRNWQKLMKILQFCEIPIAYSQHVSRAKIAFLGHFALKTCTMTLIFFQNPPILFKMTPQIFAFAAF